MFWGRKNAPPKKLDTKKSWGKWVHIIMAGQPTPPNIPTPAEIAGLNKGLWKPIGFP